MAEYGKHGYIKFDRLWELLKCKNKNKQWLRNNGMHANTISKLTKNENVTCEVLCHLCDLLECQPDDILEYVPDAEEVKRQQESCSVHTGDSRRDTSK